jgi:two-component system sensor histidine kinase/response regulator
VASDAEEARQTGSDAAAAAPFPAVAGLDTRLGLQRALGKPGLYAEMLRRFVQGQSSVISDLEQAAASADSVLAERLAHTLRSVAANIGAQEVSDHAQALEQALRSGAPPEVTTALTAAVNTSLQRLLPRLQAWVHSASMGRPADLATIDPAAQAADSAMALQQLRRLLEQDDPAAPGFLQRHAQVLQAALGSSFATLEMHTQNFDFEHALAALPAHPDEPAMPGPEHAAVHPL